MKQEIKRIDLFVILPILLTTLGLLYVGDEPRISPIIGIIGVEQ